jgi:hypothetical protein
VGQKAGLERFNLSETEKDWQEHFYEGEWSPDTLTKTQLELDIEAELGTFLPRHMDVYDWNLPYIDFITLVVRKHLSKAQTPPPPTTKTTKVDSNDSNKNRIT